jgi:hypothetical protein
MKESCTTPMEGVNKLRKPEKGSNDISYLL